MLIDIDRHVFSEIIEIRRQKRDAMIKSEKIQRRLKGEIKKITDKIHELEGQENALLLHLVSNVKETNTGKGQETTFGKKMAEQIKEG